MVHPTKDTMNTGKRMEKDHTFGMMVLNTVEIGKIIK